MLALAVLAVLLVLGGVVNLAAGHLDALSPIVVGVVLVPGLAVVVRRYRYRALAARAEATYHA